jgi:hypothetical protein
MHTSRIRQHVTAVLAALFVLSLIVTPAAARHSWGKYHWSRTTPGFAEFTVVDNVSYSEFSQSDWDAVLTNVVNDWNNPASVTEAQFTAGGTYRDGAPHTPWPATTRAPVKVNITPGTSNPNCDPKAGMIVACNAAYGTQEGWLGIATIWMSGQHITMGTAQVNDSFFALDRYRNDSERQLVMCQEIAHVFGVDHNDVNFGNVNTGTCMDYSNSPIGNEHPNYHDYELLASMYGHSDTTKSRKGSADKAPAEKAIWNKPELWGAVTERDSKARPTHFHNTLGNNREVFVFVLWADNVPVPPDVRAVDDGTVDEGGGHHGSGDHGKGDHGSGDHGKKDKSTQADDTQDRGKQAKSKKDDGQPADSRQVDGNQGGGKQEKSTQDDGQPADDKQDKSKQANGTEAKSKKDDGHQVDATQDGDTEVKKDSDKHQH